MSGRQHGAPDLSEVARQRLDALRRDLLREAGVSHEAVMEGPDRSGDHDRTMPRPGRHASRRPAPDRHLLRDLTHRLAPGLTDRPLGVPHVAVVAVFALVLVTAGAWWALRLRGGEAEVALAAPQGESARVGPASSPRSLSPPTPLVSVPLGIRAGTAVGGTGSDPGELAEADEPLIVVDVAGRVRDPGLATLPEGSRVADALAAAGGARRGVRLVSLNLARLLVDGEQVVVGVRSAGAAATTVPGDTGGVAGAVPTPLVNLNTADTVQLETLPGVGPVTAGAILTWRAEHGGFTSVEELIEVSGIGPATLEELLPYVTV